jgi:hypothetical protein
MLTSLDERMAQRALRAAVGLLDAAHALGGLDVAALSRLLPALGLGSTPADHQALFSSVPRRDGGMILGLGALPWPGPPRVVGDDVLVHGAAAQLDVALRLAAGHQLGMVPGTLRFTAQPSPVAAVPLLQLLDALGDNRGVVTLVLGPPELTVDVLSAAPRDLLPVLAVLARRRGLPPPVAGQDAVYELLPSLLQDAPGVRDERVVNDARAGVYATAGGAYVDVASLAEDAVDPRLANAVKGGEGAVVAAEVALAPLVLERLGSRIKAVLVVAPADTVAGVSVELPARLLDAHSGQGLWGLLDDAALQSKDLGPDGPGVVTGETAVVAGSPLLAGVARRATGESKAPVVDGVTGQAAFLLAMRKADGALARARWSLALYDGRAPQHGRDLVVAFLNHALAPARAVASGGSKKVRIRG